MGISVLATQGSTTELTISLTGSGLGPTTLSGTGWQYTYNGPPTEGEVYYLGTAIPGSPGIYQWVFDTGGAFNAARAELLALMAHDEIVLRQNASRFQLLTLTETPTLSGDNVIVVATTTPRLNHERPDNNATIVVTLIPGPIQGVDQTARDLAGKAQAAAETNALAISSFSGTDQTARDAAAAALRNCQRQRLNTRA